MVKLGSASQIVQTKGCLGGGLRTPSASILGSDVIAALHIQVMKLMMMMMMSSLPSTAADSGVHLS